MAVTEQSGRHRREDKRQKTGWFSSLRSRKEAPSMTAVQDDPEEVRYSIVMEEKNPSNVRKADRFQINVVCQVNEMRYKLFEHIDSNMKKLVPFYKSEEWRIALMRYEPLFLKPTPLHQASSQPLGRNPYDNS